MNSILTPTSSRFKARSAVSAGASRALAVARQMQTANDSLSFATVAQIYAAPDAIAQSQSKSFTSRSAIAVTVRNTGAPARVNASTHSAAFTMLIADPDRCTRTASDPLSPCSSASTAEAASSTSFRPSM